MIGVYAAFAILGAISGLWGYHFGEVLPIFFVLGWALNTWAACGIV
ncbi:MAG: hypothetical protein J5U17_07605 [Candidatus Methanoperedens sp.]|nr:hypothetical protein [Candidatus Methanoperedens sp.]MCE8425625.1 hypothetical protein [Candidatus Methanoperedens sp.]MCE8427353.1 hypothetical protein [Candidatus Methanoperedens sp.]